MRRLTISAAISIGVVVAILSPVAAFSTDCDAGGWAGNCHAVGSGSQVDISAGRSGRDAPPATGGGVVAPPSRPGSSSPGTTDPEPQECGRLGCRGNYTVAVPPDLTIEDLASFRPARPTLSGEPAGVAVVGMPANLVVSASEQIIEGRVLDWDVRVRFTPVSYQFAPGDGTSTVTSTGGSTWSRLGQAQFTPTATSHIYRERGTFQAGVTVRYAASVDFGSGRWRPVPGHVTASAGGYEVRALEVATALVDQTCIENPRGPGC